MIALSVLFSVKSGISKSSVKTDNEKISSDYVRFIRPSKTYRGTFDGYIRRDSVPGEKVFPSDTIYVSTDGQGSHSYAYVSSFDFVPNSNVVVLIPKQELDVVQKHYYARCITANRYKFSYGRKPKGKRLRKILLPSTNEIPKWAVDFQYVSPEIVLKIEVEPPNIKTGQWKWFFYSDLFIPRRGTVNDIRSVKSEREGLPIVSATTKNNGVIGYSRKDSGEPFLRNCLTIANTGQGSVGFPTFQDRPFFATNNITVLIPKFECNKYIGLFLCTLIKRDRYKYSWGRIANETRIRNARIRLPVDINGSPDWQFMEDYIKSLPYSSNL